MPVYDVQTKEYECFWCGYKWVNRSNGKDGPIPNKCARCKRPNWNDGKPSVDIISPKERGIRRRIRDLNLFYRYKRYLAEWPTDICEKFLNIQPRPTIEQMTEVLSVFSDQAENQAQKRIEIMTAIMKSRGVEYDLDAGIATTIEKRKAEPTELDNGISQIFTRGRKDKHEDKEIIGWINAYAKDKSYTDEQISYAINQYLSEHGQEMKQSEAAKL